VGTLTAGEVAPRASRVLALTPVRAGPQVVGSTFHLNPAAVVDTTGVWADGALEVHLRSETRGRGAVTIAVPEGSEVRRVVCEGAVLLARWAGDHGSLVVQLESIGGGTVRVAVQ